MDQIFQERRKDNTLRKIIKKYPFHKTNLIRANEELRDDLEARLKAFKSIIENEIRVFISYKFEDETAAKVISNVLNNYGGNILTIKYAENFKEAVGTEYHQAIRKAVTTANWFILLLPSNSEDLNWCLYETGLFRANMVSDKVDKLICLHHPSITKLPPQISEFQTVKAEKESIKSFLRQILINPAPLPGMDPINPTLSDEEISQCAQQIERAVPVPKKRAFTRLGNYISIALKNSLVIDETGAFLNDTEIMEYSANIPKLFGRLQMPKTWGELVSNEAVANGDNRWQRELYRVICKVVNGETFRPIQATFQPVEGSKVYRPVLCGYHQTTSEYSKIFHMEFVEEVGDFSAPHVPRHVRALITAIKMAYRFRWEILEKYSQKILVPYDVTNIEETLKRIEIEASSRGLYDPELVCAQFNKESSEIKKIYDAWHEMRNYGNPGELDKIFRDRNCRKLQQMMPDLVEMNRRFIQLTTWRLEEISEIPSLRN